MKIANCDARQYVQRLHPFEGNNLFAQFFCVDTSPAHTAGDHGYVVYSYSTHWPLFINCNGVWYENEDRASRTTSKHRTQVHPHQPTVLLSLEWMQRLVKGGYKAIAKERILGPSPLPVKQRDPVWLSAHGM